LHKLCSSANATAAATESVLRLLQRLSSHINLRPSTLVLLQNLLQNRIFYTPRFSPSYLLTPHPSSFINLPPSQLLIVDPTRHSHSLSFSSTPSSPFLLYYASSPHLPRHSRDLHRRAAPKISTGVPPLPPLHPRSPLQFATAEDRLRQHDICAPLLRLPRGGAWRGGPLLLEHRRRSRAGDDGTPPPLLQEAPLSLWRRVGGPVAGSFPPSPPHMLRRRREEAGELVVRSSGGSPAPHRRRHLRRRICARHGGPPPLPLPARRGRRQNQGGDATPRAQAESRAAAHLAVLLGRRHRAPCYRGAELRGG
jgi:hypothetical protein